MKFQSILLLAQILFFSIFAQVSLKIVLKFPSRIDIHDSVMQYVENLEKAHFVKLKFCQPAHYVDAYLEMQGKKRSIKYKLLDVNRTFIVPVASCDK